MPFLQTNITLTALSSFLFSSRQYQSKPDAAAYQPTPGSSALLPSSLQHQANCLQALHKSIQQFNQHLKTERLDRPALHFIVLQLQNDFALLRYLLFSPVETMRFMQPIEKNACTNLGWQLEPIGK